ncbi:MAG: hypothetical protein WC718_00340 [Phycisphaerales bacterium]|jgi:hypothetical protein
MPDLTTITRDIEAAPNGWRYTVPETGVTLTAKWARSLRTKVLAHMEANGVPEPADFDEVFADAACRESGLGPPYCGPDTAPPKPAGQIEFLTWAHVGRFLKAAATYIANPRSHVSAEEADRRFAICLACPLRVDIGNCVKCHGLTALVAAAEVAVGTVTGRKITDGRQVCGACGCFCASKPILKIPVLRKLDKGLDVVPVYDAGCWMHDQK